MTEEEAITEAEAEVEAITETPSEIQESNSLFNGTPNKPMNPKKMAKQLKNNPQLINMINAYQKGQLTDGPSKSLTPRERLQKQLEQSKMSRMSKIGQSRANEVKKLKIDEKKKELEKEINDLDLDLDLDKDVNNNIPVVSNGVSKYNLKMKKLNKKYGVISFSQYMENLELFNKFTTEDENKSEYHISKNIINLYKYQNKNTMNNIKTLDIDLDLDED